ncbi:MAG: hypothetical protein IE927_04880 [Rhodobacterales bacterium]|nr:hypothetical protein [Rhodobacterales bacterium]
MTDRLMALAAFAVLAAFLAAIVINVPRLDLGLAIGATLVLAAWDFFGHRS